MGWTGEAPTQCPMRPRRVVYVLALALALVAPASLVGRPEVAGAQSEDPLFGVSVEVDSRWPGRFVEGRALPVVVRVTSERSLRGSVTVEWATGGVGATGRQPVAVPVEAPAGATVEVTVVVPPIDPVEAWATGFGNGIVDGSIGRGPSQDGSTATAQIRATVRSGDRSAVAGARLVHEPGDELVGLLPQLADNVAVPAAAPLRGTDTEATVLALTPADLRRGAAGLALFGTLLADPADLAELGPLERGAVAAWVAQGGHLVVEAGDEPLDGVAELLRPPTRGIGVVGGGTVRRAVDLDLASVDAVLDPTGASRSRDTSTWFGPSGDVVQPAVDDPFTAWGPMGPLVAGATPKSLVDAAGLRQGGLDLMLWMATGYALVVGPVLFFVLGRTGKRTLGWVAVPALALAGTLGVVASGLWKWSSAQPVQVSTVLVAAKPDGTVGDTGLVSATALAPRTGGAEVTARTPAPAVAGGVGLGEYRVIPLEDSGDQLTGRASLDPGTAATVTAEYVAPLTTSPSVRILRADDGHLVAEVTNRLDVPLDAAHLVGPQLTSGEIGPVGPGATITVQLDGVGGGGIEQPYRGQSCGRCAIRTPVAGSVELLAGPAFREPGTVTLVANSAGVVAPLEIGGSPVTVGVTTWVVPVTTYATGTTDADVVTPDPVDADEDLGSGNGVGPPLPSVPTTRVETPSTTTTAPPDPATPNDPSDAAPAAESDCGWRPPSELDGRTAVAARTSVAAGPGAVLPGLGFLEPEAAVVRIDLLDPDVADGLPPAARLVVPGALETVRVFDGQQWQPVRPGCALPPGAATTGVVLVLTRTRAAGIGPDPSVFAGTTSFLGGGRHGWTAPFRELGIVIPGSDNP